MDPSMDTDLLLLAETVTTFLESPYKPLLVFLPFVPWAWLISSRIDKDAMYFHLNRELWNAINLSAGAAALAAVLFIPIFWVGWPVMLVLLTTPILFYWQHRNREVPEKQRFVLSGESLSTRMDQRRQAKATRDAMLQFISAEGEVEPVPQKEDPAYPVHMLAEDLLGPALDARASHVEVAVGQSGCALAQMVDGIKYKRDALPADSGLKLVDYIKGMAGLDVEDRRRRQTGEFRMRGPRGQTDLVATTAGSSQGLILRVEFDRSKRLSRPFDAMGLLPSQIDSLATLLEMHDRHGIVLVGAPPTHGLSTSIYSFISRHDAYTSNIKTLEREQMIQIDGVDQVVWDPTNPDIDYATNLQSMLRRDPDIVMLSLIRDPETAQTACDPGMTGPLIYIPQRTGTIPEQIREWVKQVGDVKRATKALRAVVNQRLLRTLCPNCRQAYQPTEEQLRKLNLLSSKVTTLYRPSGKVQVKNKIENCPVCGGNGYLGQTGVFEVFVVDDAARKLLQGGDLKAALGHARRHKMIYLQEAALSKVASGETTIEEVVRVTSPPKKGGGGNAPKAQSAPASAG
ncbi:MAG: Flp pilus assembly complex ATPase component [Planctomycetes bacterium]|nr:Flp pilus assembly complex ATPase component [Planctomycetota bacterium]